MTSAEERAHYQAHNNDVNDVGYQKFTSPITNAILANQTKEQLGLDFGCGTGPVITKLLKDQDYQVQTYDPYFHPNESYLNLRYNYIFSCEVFEHFYNPKHEIEKLLDLLRPSGRLYIMTHLFKEGIDFKTWYYRKDTTHVFIYTEQTMRFIAETYNLEIDTLDERITVFSKP
ncbi:class I SAM-dependent methyltransferase [Mangrovimonas aestuarii]|uniref:class I SAM-dependent methyltransferase n=1 Tax=Mangrovimonas aestuarii TaxID=3018443 RepID=UPI002379C279|nr:class I SAM-dependent methyltransferase [Mangrovimonas aestuarii]